MFKDATDYDITLKVIRNKDLIYKGENYAYWASKLNITNNCCYRRMVKNGHPFKVATVGRPKGHKGNNGGRTAKPVYNGKTTPELAKELNISCYTVRQRIKNHGTPYIKLKLGRPSKLKTRVDHTI